MFSAKVIITALAATAVYAGDAEDRKNFDAFSVKNAENDKFKVDIARLQTLTTGTPITDECISKGFKEGKEFADCKTGLAKELLDTQIRVQQAFFAAFIDQFLLFGQKFDRNKINNFDIANECVRVVDGFKDILDQKTIDDLKAGCRDIKASADKLRTAVRDQLDTAQKTVDNQVQVDQALLKLDDAHLPFFDKVLNAVQQNAFVDLVKDGDRAKQSFAGFQLGQLSATLVEFLKSNYRNYKGEVALKKADLGNEVQILLQLATVELQNNQLIIDAGKRLNALAKAPTPNALVVKGALDLAAKRKDVVETPVAIHWQVSDVDVAQEAATVALFKASMGAETFALKGVKQANGKLLIDMATGVNENEIATRESELGLTCIEKALTCKVVEDVHKPTFDLAQYAEPPKKPADPVKPGNPYVAETQKHHDTQASASSLFMAAGAVLASLVLFL